MQHNLLDPTAFIEANWSNIIPINNLKD